MAIMSLIDKKEQQQAGKKSKVKLLALVVGGLVSLSVIGGVYMLSERDQGASSIGAAFTTSSDSNNLSLVAKKSVANQDVVNSVGLPESVSPDMPTPKQDDIDKVSLDISKRFFGGRLVEYIEFNEESGLYALIPSGSGDVYFVNKDRTVVIKGDAYLVSSSSATLINDKIKASHKENFKKPVDVLSLVDKSSPLNEKKPQPASAENHQDNWQSGESVVAPLDQVESKGEGETVTFGVDASQGANRSDGEVLKDTDGDSSVLDRLASGETVRPVREPTQEEIDEIKAKTEEENAKVLFGQKLKDDYLLVYTPPEGVRTVATINVFADPECPSCKKLHKDVSNLLALGVKVRYIAMPRKGLDSPIAKQMAVAFCSPDKRSTFDSLFQGKRYDTDVDGFDSCFSLVSKNANLGYSLRIKHTPTIYSSETGKVFEGYPSGDSAYISLLEQLGVANLLGKK